MKRSILLLLVVAFALLLFACSENPSTAPGVTQNEFVENTMAKKPAPKLIGKIDCDFTGTAPYFWVGTVDFGKDGVYGIRYEALTRKDVGNVYHFTENFEIHIIGDPDNIILSGSDFGVLAFSNFEGRMNGLVEVANPPFGMWLGRNLHMSGAAIMGPDGPVAFDGTIRIN